MEISKSLADMRARVYCVCMNRVRKPRTSPENE